MSGTVSTVAKVIACLAIFFVAQFITQAANSGGQAWAILGLNVIALSSLALAAYLDGIKEGESER